MQDIVAERRLQFEGTISAWRQSNQPVIPCIGYQLMAREKRTTEEDMEINLAR